MTTATPLLRRLNAASTPYVDPLAAIQWQHVATDAWWLPPQALSLAGVPEFDRLPLALRRRLSHWEFGWVLETGLWLESLFIERFARASECQADASLRRFFLHEIREEAGHSLMFLELLERSGVRLPPAARPRSALATAAGRVLPFRGALFWGVTVIGEELGDSVTRLIPDAVKQVMVSAVVYHMARLHMRDEARHVAYTRAACADAVRRLPRWRRAALAPLVALAFNAFARQLYYPPRELYACAGLPQGTDWRGLARASAARRAFVARATKPTREFLQDVGWNIRYRITP